MEREHWTAVVLTCIGVVAVYFHYYFIGGFAWVCAILGVL